MNLHSSLIRYRHRQSGNTAYRLQARPSLTGAGLWLTAMPSPGLPFYGRHRPTSWPLSDACLQTKEELGRTKSEYEALNAQLLDDLPKLFVLSSEILFSAVHLFIRLQYGFYAHAANQFSAAPLVRLRLSLLVIFLFNCTMCSSMVYKTSKY